MALMDFLIYSNIKTVLGLTVSFCTFVGLYLHLAAAGLSHDEFFAVGKNAMKFWGTILLVPLILLILFFAKLG